MVGAGLFFADGDEWTRQRRATTAGLGPRSLDRYAPSILDVLDRRLDELAGGGGTVDVLTLTQRLALDVAGEALLGFDMERHGAEVRALIDWYTLRAGKPDFLDYFMPVGLPTVRDPERWLIGWRWRRLLGRMIAERRGRARAEPDLFDALCAARPAAGAPDLREEIATTLLAGHETTALAMFWAIYVLALAPGLQGPLVEEARSFRPDRLGTAAVARALPRTRALVEEVLRLYPPAYLMVRVARGPDELSGVAVRRRDVILISPWVLHRHRRLWSDPEAFDPARFLRPDSRPRFAYLPFGAGPRICVGAAFALLEATLFVARLLDRFEPVSVEAAPVIPTGIVTLQPDRRARFQLKPRRR
jgi:cytochrome P450